MSRERFMNDETYGAVIGLCVGASLVLLVGGFGGMVRDWWFERRGMARGGTIDNARDPLYCDVCLGKVGSFTNWRGHLVHMECRTMAQAMWPAMAREEDD